MTPSEFKAQFPDGEFNALDSAYVQEFLDKAVPMFDVDRWGAFYSEGLACYTGNAIVVSKARAARLLATGLRPDADNVTEKHVGPVGQTVDSILLNKQADDQSMATSYGRRYRQLRKLIGMGGASV